MFGRKRREHKKELERLQSEMAAQRSIETKIAELREKIEDRRYMRFVNGEQGTKNALIEPFLLALGFDPSDAEHVRLERRIKAGAADYVLYVNQSPVFIVEAKSHAKKLGRYRLQAAKYFDNLPTARVALLTNGKEYRFYANDFELTAAGKGRRMADKPFLLIKLTEAGSAQISALEFFTAANFHPEAAPQYIERLHKTIQSNITRAMSAADNPKLIAGIRAAIGLPGNVMSNDELRGIISGMYNQADDVK